MDLIGSLEQPPDVRCRLAQNPQSSSVNLAVQASVVRTRRRRNASYHLVGDLQYSWYMCHCSSIPSIQLTLGGSNTDVGMEQSFQGIEAHSPLFPAPAGTSVTQTL